MAKYAAAEAGAALPRRRHPDPRRQRHGHRVRPRRPVGAGAAPAHRAGEPRDDPQLRRAAVARPPEVVLTPTPRFGALRRRISPSSGAKSVGSATPRQTDGMQAPAQRYVGHRVARVEDPRLLTGHGKYVDDVTVPGMLHAHFVRSPFAHAHIRGIDVDAARRHPGRGRGLHRRRHAKRSRTRSWAFCRCPTSTTRCSSRSPPTRCGSSATRWRWSIAESRYVAEDAAQLVVVDYEELAPIATIEHALDSTRPAIWPGPGGNVLQRDRRDYGDVDAAFARRRPGRARAVRAAPLLEPADGDARVRRRGRPDRWARVQLPLGHAEQPRHEVVARRAHRAAADLAVAGRDRPSARAHGGAARRRPRRWRRPTRPRRERGRHRRSTPRIEEPIGEGLSAPASPGKSMAQTFLREPVRIAHLARMLLGLLARDPVTLPRVTAQDIGGAFGVKVLPTREDVAVLAAAVDLGRSVKWIEDRNEHLLVAGQAREETLDVEAALRDDGTLLGLRVHMTHGPGRVPGVPVQRRDVPDDDPHDDPGSVPARRARVHDHAHRVEQGDLRRLPRPVGGRDLGARAHARHRRARRSASVATRSGCATSSGPTSCRGRCSPGRRSTCACRRAPPSNARSRSPTSSTGPRQQEAARAEGRCVGPRVRHLHRGRAGSARLPGVGHGRAAAAGCWRVSRPARCSSPTAPCRCTRSRCRTARATRRPWPRSRPTSSACRSSRCASATATRRSPRSGSPAPAAAGRRRWPAVP